MAPTNLQVLGRLLAGGVPSPGSDWEGVAALAQHFGLSPLLFYWLSQEKGGAARPVAASPSPVPAEQWAALRRDLLSSMRNWVVAARQVGEVLEALSAAEVPVVVIKGPATQSYYPQPELRAYCDIDLWIPAGRLIGAAAALKARGYCLPERMPAWTWKRHHHLQAVHRHGAALPVELHRTPADLRSMGGMHLEEMWHRAVPWSIDGKRALRLETADAVLLLATHAVTTDGCRWWPKAACDLAAMTRGWTIAEWQSLADRARSYELERPLYFLLLLSEAFLGVFVPQEVMSPLRVATGGVRGERLAPFLEAETLGKLRAVDGPAQLAAGLSPRARLGILAASLILPRHEMAHLYGLSARSPLVWLAYPWRPVHLAWRYLRTLGLSSEGRTLFRHDAWLRHWLHGGPG